MVENRYFNIYLQIISMRKFSKVKYLMNLKNKFKFNENSIKI